MAFTSSSSSSSLPPPHFPDGSYGRVAGSRPLSVIKEEGLGETGDYPVCDHESCVANALGNLCQSFLLSYGIRVGMGILRRAFKLARHQSYSSIFDLKVHSIELQTGFM